LRCYAVVDQCRHDTWTWTWTWRSVEHTTYGQATCRRLQHGAVCPRRCYEDVGVSGDFPVQLATRLPEWSAGGLLPCIVLPVVVVRVSCRSPNSTSPTRTTCCSQVASNLVASSVLISGGIVTRYVLPVCSAVELS